MNNLAPKHLALAALIALLGMACSDSSNRSSVSVDNNDVAVEEVWEDQATGLYWQLHGRGHTSTDFRGIIPAEAHEYCEDLEEGGFSDWRLPTYAELQSIIAGNPETEAGGACQVGAEGAGTSTGNTAACASTGSGGEYGGPGLNGCYWKDGLEGACDRIDPFGRHPYETIAADPAHDKPTEWISYVTFATGAAGYNHACSLGEVRCVRSDDPEASCELNDRPCNDYYPSKAYCDQDLTSQADVLRVTISLPEPPAVEQPYQVLGFLYESGPDWFPPIGPPAGGTDYNQVFLAEAGAAIISETTPLVMDIPATTYYREALLRGDYQLFIMLQMENIFPPIPVDGDFVYGETGVTISLPLNGVEHSGQILELEVELDLVGCPADRPVACRDGSCAVDEAACGITSLCPEQSSCFPNCPGDDDIFSCIYENAFAGGVLSVIDYPSDEGWTEESALANCGVFPGADNPRMVSGDGQSNLVQVGGNSAGRCVFTDDEKRSFVQDIGLTFCELGGGIWEDTGPYCSSY